MNMWLYFPGRFLCCFATMWKQQNIKDILKKKLQQKQIRFSILIFHLQYSLLSLMSHSLLGTWRIFLSIRIWEFGSKFYISSLYCVNITGAAWLPKIVAGKIRSPRIGLTLHCSYINDKNSNQKLYDWRSDTFKYIYSYTFFPKSPFPNLRGERNMTHEY